METIIAGISGFVLAILAAFLGKKKSHAEIGKIIADTSKTELDTVEQAARIWRELSASLRDELTVLRKEYIQIGVQYNTVLHQYEALKQDYENLKQEHNDLHDILFRMKEENSALKQKLNDFINIK